jgi:hypothetical protein
MVPVLSKYIQILLPATLPEYAGMENATGSHKKCIKIIKLLDIWTSQYSRAVLRLASMYFAHGNGRSSTSSPLSSHLQCTLCSMDEICAFLIPQKLVGC